MVKIFVGNLPYCTDDRALRAVFERHGPVHRAGVVLDPVSGRARGFGFVEMPDPNGARRAIAALDGACLAGRALVVHEARPRPSAPAPV